MIAPELHAQIRRLFFAEHWPENTIAVQLGVHHDTVRRAVERERFIRPGSQIRPSALDPYKRVILATHCNTWPPAHRRMEAHHQALRRIEPSRRPGQVTPRPENSRVSPMVP